MGPIIGDSRIIPHMNNVRIVEAIVVIIDCTLRHLPVFTACAVVGGELLSMVGWCSRKLNKRRGCIGVKVGF